MPLNLEVHAVSALVRCHARALARCHAVLCLIWCFGPLPWVLWSVAMQFYAFSLPPSSEYSAATDTKLSPPTPCLHGVQQQLGTNPLCCSAIVAYWL